MTKLEQLRHAVRDLHLADEGTTIAGLIRSAGLTENARHRITDRAVEQVRAIRESKRPGLMEVFLAEYGLSTDEGVALMCLAEALLRVPDKATIDELIEDKIATSSWSAHLGQSSSPLVNASTWALMLTGSVLKEEGVGLVAALRGTVKRLGEPVIRTAVTQAMRELGRQFVLGRTIDEAMTRAAHHEELGLTYSYDMLGEAAQTAADADAFFRDYAAAISALSSNCTAGDVRDNPGISVKLSALHPRFEYPQKKRVMSELVPLVKALALMAKKASMGFNIDAEEADRLDLSLDVIEAVLSDPALANWDGFGVVVQAYGKRAPAVVDWLYALAIRHDRSIMVRLVKGAYWDTEIKIAQVGGHPDYSVFTTKPATDISYICCAQKLLGMTDRIYPQFATHNAHTVAAILELSVEGDAYEFQRLHGMGEALHATVREMENSRCRVYAPVGAHKDLLAYLVRRLLENGANSSFVNQVVDNSVPAEIVATDPFELHAQSAGMPSPIAPPAQLFAPERANSKGLDVRNSTDLESINRARQEYQTHLWHAEPLIAAPVVGGDLIDLHNPADPSDRVGTVHEASANDAEAALVASVSWGNTSASQRAKILRKAAELFEDNTGEFLAVLAREAGKTLSDGIGEIREAVDFLYYYASQAEGLLGGEAPGLAPRGVIGCISPWNFPLAIFTGQIAAALAAGNGVLAKPAESTPIVASIAVKLLHTAGVPRACLQLLPGPGSVVGAALASDPRVDGICFTGSTATAQSINRAMAAKLAPGAPLIAETGGLNAMIVDSSALPHQAVMDIVTSAFQSAGQRCSALRIVYLQQDIADEFLQMLFGAVDELKLGNPWELDTDVGPLISVDAQLDFTSYVAAAQSDGRLLKKLDQPALGNFIGPAILRVGGIKDMAREIFGPVLHVATFGVDDIGQVVDDINNCGYGLTFGLHTRIDDRVEFVTSRLRVGNKYINRNQIGAVVGSQPFGGEGLSGTGPKAGGPKYLRAFMQPIGICEERPQPMQTSPKADLHAVETLLRLNRTDTLSPISTCELSGPTGESNQLSEFSRGTILCLGPSPEQANQQRDIAGRAGCAAIIVTPGATGKFALSGWLDRSELQWLEGFSGVALWSDEADQRQAKIALASRKGQLIPLFSERNFQARCVIERHLCVDTTAAGGNAQLMAAADDG